MFYPPIFGWGKHPLKTAQVDLCLIKILWLKNWVLLILTPLPSSQILANPSVFYPPIFGWAERPLKTAQDNLWLIRILWLKNWVLLIFVRPYFQSQILANPPVFYPPIFGWAERPLKTAQVDLWLIRILWLKNCFFLFYFAPTFKVKFWQIHPCFTPQSLVEVNALQKLLELIYGSLESYG